MKLRTLKRGALRPPSDLPARDARIPAVTVRLALAAAGVLLTLMVYGDGWIVVGVLLSLIAALAPDLLFPWALILFLGLGELGRHATLDWQLLVLIAGVQFLHAVGMLSLELPWRGWIQPAVLSGPLRRLVAIQVPVQCFAVLVLELLAPTSHGQRPVEAAALGLIGAAALAGLAALLLRAIPEGRTGN